MTTTALHTAQPPPLRAHVNPLAMARNLWRHRQLILQFARRQIESRYKGQHLGLLWVILTPILMLAVYTFVFGVIFQGGRWGDQKDGSIADTALYIFVGLLVFGIFRDVVSKAPSLIVHNPNYVKKVIFPLEVLTVSDLLAALVTFVIGAGVWLLGYAVFVQQIPSAGMLLVPLLLLPVCLLAMGLGWILASLGVFLRDLSNAVEVAMMMLFFLTPIFYSVELVPAGLRPLIRLNPLAAAITSVRDVTLTRHSPDMLYWLIATGISGLVALLGYAFFMKSKRAFGDVL